MVGIRGLLFKFSFPLNGALEISDKFFSCFFFEFNHILLSFSFCKLLVSDKTFSAFISF